MGEISVNEVKYEYENSVKPNKIACWAVSKEVYFDTVLFL